MHCKMIRTHSIFQMTPESFEDTPNEDFDTDSDSIPLDVLLSILLAGAAVFGIRKLRKK